MEIDKNARYAGEIASRAGDSFDSFSELRTMRQRFIPKVSWDDIHIEKLLGEGRFSAVYSCTVSPPDHHIGVVQEGEDENDDAEDGTNGTATKNLVASGNGNNGISAVTDLHPTHTKIDYSKKYALKVLRAESMSDRNSFRATAVDMVRESKLLSCLEHPNVITLYGLRAGAVSQSFRGNGFFMLLEPLTFVLDKKFRSWRKIKEEDKGSKRGIGGLLSKSPFKNKGNSRRGSFFQKSKSKSSQTLQAKEESSPIDNTTNKSNDKHTVIHGSKDYLPTLLERIEYVALGIAKGMEYIHSQRVIFRDLKPENVGFDHDDNIRIFDFGIAKEILPGQEHKKLTGKTGTIRYMAPENALCQEYGLPVDSYSFGILLWELCALKRSFEKMTVDQFKSKVHVENSTFRPSLTKDKLNKLLSPELKDLIEKCWDYNPNVRPTFTDIVVKLQNELKSPHYS